MSVEFDVSGNCHLLDGTQSWLMIASMSEHSICAQCGSESLVVSGVLEHGSWIRRLTCWTCKDCRSIVVMPDEQDVLVGDH